MKSLIFGIFLLTLTGCGGGGGGDDGGSSVITSSSFIGNGSSATICQTDTTNFSIIGDGNTVTFCDGTDINTLNLTGSNNLLTFGPGFFSVASLEVIGSDNTFSVPTGTNGTFDTNIGSGNQFIEY